MSILQEGNNNNHKDLKLQTDNKVYIIKNLRQNLIKQNSLTLKHKNHKKIIIRPLILESILKKAKNNHKNYNLFDLKATPPNQNNHNYNKTYL